MKYNLILFTGMLLALLVNTAVVVASGFDDEDKSNWKDPRTRDEDISHTQITVKTKRNENGLYLYGYTFFSPPENKGTVRSFYLDLSCDLDFSTVEFPALDTIRDSSNGKHVPVGTVAVAKRNEASANLSLAPGKKTVVFITSPAPPEERSYSIRPEMSNDGWRYDLYPEAPWIHDFVVRGTVLGPACTLDFDPVIE